MKFKLLTAVVAAAGIAVSVAQGDVGDIQRNLGVTKGSNSCSGSSPCGGLAAAGGTATIGNNSCTGWKSCEDAAKTNGKIAIGNGSCTGSNSCDEAGRSGGDATIGNKSCTGSKSCDDLGNGGKATVGAQSCTKQESCESAGREDGDATIGNKSCTESDSCQHLAQKRGKAVTGSESCTKNFACKLAGYDGGDANIAAKSCTGSSSCVELGRKRGKAVTSEGSCTQDNSCKAAGFQGDADIGENSCTGSQSCLSLAQKGKAVTSPGSCTKNQSCKMAGYEEGDADIGATSCTGSQSCVELGRDKGKAVTSEGSCTHNLACRYAGKEEGDVDIGENSCTGSQSCQFLGWKKGKAVVGPGSCKANQSCLDAGEDGGDVVIGPNSCTSNKSCMDLGDNGKAVVGAGSCTGDESCYEAGDGADITIGDGSCTGGKACKGLKNDGKIIIGDNSCTCWQCCMCLRDGDIIPDNSCTTSGECCNGDSRKSATIEALTANAISEAEASPSPIPGTEHLGNWCTNDQGRRHDFAYTLPEAGRIYTIEECDQLCRANNDLGGLRGFTMYKTDQSCGCFYDDGTVPGADLPEGTCPPDTGLDVCERKHSGSGEITGSSPSGTQDCYKYLDFPVSKAEGSCASQDNSPAVADVTMTDDKCSARGWGDPHLATWDGLRYDVHVHGELIFAKDPNSSFQIQARTEPVENHPAKPAVTTGIVITDDDMPKIQVSMPRDTDEPCTEVINGCPVELYVEDVLRKPSHGSGSSLAKVDVSGKKIIIQYPSSSLKVVMSVNSWRNECHFSVTYIFGTCPTGLVGLLGSPDGEWRNDWMDTDGNPIPIPSNLRRGSGFRPTFEYARDNWCVPNVDASNFAYEHDTSFEFFDVCDNPNVDQLAAAVENADEAIKKACHQDVFCVLDTVAFAEAGDLTAIAEVVDDFNADEGLHHPLKQTASATFPVVEQVPDDLGNPNCPTCKAVGWGDPHVVTFDGVSYDVHPKGELTFLKSLDPDNDFTIQARTVAVKNHPKGPAVTTAVVVHEDSRLGLPDVQVSLGKDSSSVEATKFTTARGDECYVQLFVDKVAMDILGGSGTTAATVQVDGNRIVVEYPTTNLKLVIKVTSWREECHFSIDYYLVDCRCDETLVGILGQPDFPRDWENDWHDHDGNAVPIPSRRSDRRGKKAYEYSRTWCITAAESKFAYEPGMGHSDFDECIGTKGDDNFEIDIPAIIEDLETTNPGAVDQCTQEGDDEPDEGCLMDCFFGGPDACTEFEETVAAVIQDTQTAPIVFPPEPEIVLQVPDTPTGGAGAGNCPVCKAVGWGDPHVITFDGVSYDMHGKGEFTFLKSTTSDFTIQARTAVVSGHPRGPAVTTGVLVHESGEPTVQVSFGSNANSEHATMFGQCPVQLFVNGAAMDITQGTGLDAATVQVNGKRIVVEYINSSVRLDMKIGFWRGACYFSVTYFLADCPCDGSLVGILGQPGGGWVNDWHEHDGTPVPIPSSRRKRRGKPAYDYSLTWCLTDTDSHFTYEPGMDHSDHDFCTGNKGEENSVEETDIDDLIAEADDAVINQCTIDNEVDEGCVLDCELLGTEACDEFVDTVQNTATAVITDSPTSGPTSGPSKAPSPSPTSAPTTSVPSKAPSPSPTSAPTLGPSKAPAPVPPIIPNIPDSQQSAAAADASPNSGSQGDPHFKTWRNEHYEYHGQCDLVLAKDPNFCDGLGFDVQIRTKLVRFWSYIKSAAIRIGNDIFEVEGSVDGEMELKYWMNLQFRAPAETIGGFPIRFVNHPDAVKKAIHIDLNSKYPGVKIVIEVYKEFVKVDFQNASYEAFGKAVGMLGDFKTGKTLGRDGVTEIHDFHKLGNEWQVLPTDFMLFHKTEAPQFPKKCIEPEDPRGDRMRRLEESSVSAEDAEKACASLTDELDRKDCVYDIVATQDMDMAGAY